MKLHAVKFGLALGIVWGISIFAMAISGAYMGFGDQLVDIMSSLYIGYSASATGALIGLVWGFADAFVGGFVVAWIYNKLIG